MMACVVAVESTVTLKVSVTHLAGQLANWLFLYGEPDVNGLIETNRIVGKVTWTLRYEWLFISGTAIAGIAVAVLIQTSLGYLGSRAGRCGAGEAASGSARCGDPQ